MVTTDNYQYRLNEQRLKAIMRSQQQQALAESAQKYRAARRPLLLQVAQWLVAGAAAVHLLNKRGLFFILGVAALPQFVAEAQDFNTTDAGTTEHRAMVHYQVAHYYDVIGDYERAAAEYSRTLELLPNFSQAYEARGNCYAAQGLYDLAIADYSQAIGITPANARIYYSRGLAYYEQRDIERASADFRRAAELGYSGLYRSMAAGPLWN